MIGTQAFVYAKSGLYERYRVPGALAAALLVACLVRSVASAARPAADETSSPAERRRARRRRVVVVAASAAALVPLGAFRIGPVAAEAARYARDGRATQAFLDAVTRLRAGSRIVVAGGILGVSKDFWSMHWYLELRGHDVRVSYLLVQPEGEVTPFQEQLLAAFPTNSFFPKFRRAAGDAPPDAIALLRGEERGFLRQGAGWFDPATYAKAEFPGGLALYTRREW